MVFKSTFYDTSGTDPATRVDEVKWSKAHPWVGLSTYGVKGAGDFKVTPHPSTPLALNIAPGEAWGHGVKDDSDSIVTLTAEPVTGDRWDMVAIRRDWRPTAGGPTSAVLVKGSAAKALPAARENRPGTIDDQPIALVRWKSGQSQPVEMIDLRVWAGPGGALARDVLAMSFMDHLATVITVGNTRWARVLDSNGSPTWEPEGKPIVRDVNATSAGYVLSGTVEIAPTGGGRKKVTGALNIRITTGNPRTLPYTLAGGVPPIRFANVLPAEASGPASVLHVPVWFAGAGTAAEALAVVIPGNQGIEMRGAAAGTPVRVPQTATINFAYFI